MTERRQLMFLLAIAAVTVLFTLLQALRPDGSEPDDVPVVSIKDGDR